MLSKGTLILFSLAIFEGLVHCQSSTPSASTIYFPQAATTSVYSAATTLPYHKNASYPYLGQAPAQAAFPSLSPPTGPKCVVVPLGWGQDDSSQILAAVDKCGTNGTITLPAPYVYTVSKRMHMKLENARFEIFGTLSFTPDLVSDS